MSPAKRLPVTRAHPIRRLTTNHSFLLVPLSADAAAAAVVDAVAVVVVAAAAMELAETAHTVLAQSSNSGHASAEDKYFARATGSAADVDGLASDMPVVTSDTLEEAVVVAAAAVESVVDDVEGGRTAELVDGGDVEEHTVVVVAEAMH